MQTDRAVTYYPNFDWLRLLFALQVVAIHCGVTTSVFINPVPAFLAISGFVVLGSLERRPIGQFFISRALRVLPLLFVSFAAVWALYGHAEMVKNVKYWVWPSGAVPVNPVVWSLIYEEVFYALLATLFAIGVYRRKIGPVLICAAVLALTVKYTFVLLPSTWYILGSAFFIGNVMYLFRDSIRKHLNKWVALALFAFLVFKVHGLPYNDIVRHPMIYMDLLSFIAMIAFAIAGPSLPRLKIDISYSLYLTHCIVRNEFFGVLPYGSAKFFIVVLLCTLPICYFSWHLIEKPALGLKDKIPVALRRVFGASPVRASR